VARPVTANWEDTIELLGVDMPDRAPRSTKFQMTLWFRVNKRPTQNYKILVHFDRADLRFQGDHEPINGRCTTTSWQPGDIIKDTFEVEAGRLTNPKGTYVGYVGFFTGGSGLWKNAKVLSEAHDNDNRVPIGNIVVE